MYERWGAAPPTSEAHGTEADVLKNMTRLLPSAWRLEGNQLIGETEMGRIAQFIPTDYILRGTDDLGRPILTKIKV